MYIVATLGPKTMDEMAIKRIADEGVDAFRINLAHNDKKNIIKNVKFIKEHYPNIKIVGDITGKKVRVSNKLNQEVKIVKGDVVLFCSEDEYDGIYNEVIDKNIKIIPVNLRKKLIDNSDIRKILIKDGRYKLQVIGKSRGIIQCVSKNNIYISKGKSCTIKYLNRSNMRIPDKDFEDIEFIIKNKMDAVLLSFISDKNDVKKYKEEIESIMKNNNCNIDIWAKIETKEGIKNIKSISDEVDTIVFGRGDMTAEGGLINVPIYQEKICNSLYDKGKNLIIATNIMDGISLIGRPSLAELNDIFTLIKYGASGFMLTSETSVGKHPVETVKYLKLAANKYAEVFRRRNIKRRKDK